MKTKLITPAARLGTGPEGQPALLLTVGSRQWPVVISPEDFGFVTRTTGYYAWGVQGRHVVVGDPLRSFGRRSVAKIIAGITGGMRAVYRDHNPLNLLRENIGIRGTGGTFWLALRPGETDPIHFNGAFPNRVPAAIYHHRNTVPPPRDAAQAGRMSQDHWTMRGA